MTDASAPPPAVNPGRPLDEIETWIFDLDNTLYPASCRLFADIEQRMATFIMTELRLDFAAAHALRRHFYTRHGTTLRGLMLEYGLAPTRFLDFVHEIDLAAVQPDPALDQALARLPGRKLVFTNSTRRHAERVLQRLALGHHFSVIHDIIACDYRPKPEPAIYAELVERHAIDPNRAAMVEDMAKNLPPAAALGMTTVWITGGPHAADDGHGAHIHHRTDALAAFLAAVPARG
ncbi:MAG TPA: pyrimidine 5'-nucleotidase [Stellaceae bacterium]|nr:pyrimidine 5'-nucleotidase [Stellaceae bacterium]